MCDYEYGRWLSSPPPGEEVVISGISGRLPESKNVEEFFDHLLNKTDLVTESRDVENGPKRAKIEDLDKFDAGFFEIHHSEADVMDPMVRIFLECAVEAVMDAGVNPIELEGRKTGVFVSSSWVGCDYGTLVGEAEPGRRTIFGYMRSLIAHRISYFLKLQGPAMLTDAACSGSMNAMDAAFKAIRSGRCDSALVGGANLVLHPAIPRQLLRLGILSPTDRAKVFDQTADGYVQSEAIVCLFLQKSKQSRRIYAQIVHSKVTCDGYTNQSITFPSSEAQEQLLTEIYNESGITPCELSYFEAHAAGTKIGDFEEVTGIDGAVATKRSEPLLVGSIKSNMGHSETASGLCSILKVLLAMERELIPPNINLTQTRKDVKGFAEGRLKVVTEVTKLNGGALVGINNFGFGGNNAHVILRQHNKKKSNAAIDDLPRLVCVSGRSQEGVQTMLKHVGRHFEVEHVALLHQIFNTKMKTHPYRGYIVNGKSGACIMSTKLVAEQLPPLVVYFGHLTNFRVLGNYLSKFPIVEETIAGINAILVKENVATFNKILGDDTNCDYDILGAVCVQLIVAKIITDLDIVVTSVYVSSYDNLVRNYYNNVSFEHIVLAALKLCYLNFDAFSYNKLSRHKLNTVDAISVNNLAKRSIIISVSDSQLSDKDVRIVEGNNVKFLEALGRLFEAGYTFPLHKLYSPVSFPVSRSTPTISPSIRWNHQKSWYTYKFTDNSSRTACKEYTISLLDKDYNFISEHVMDGHNVFPSAEYLCLVWKTLAQSHQMPITKIPIVFTNCKFFSELLLQKETFLKLSVTIQSGSGHFQVLNNNCSVATGCVHAASISYDVSLPTYRTEDFLQHEDVYRELQLKGYNYGGVFKGIQQCSVDASCGFIKWEKNWTGFVTNMMEMMFIQGGRRSLQVAVGINKLVIDPLKHLEVVAQLEKDPIVPVNVYTSANIVKSGGIELTGLQLKSVNKEKQQMTPVLSVYKFVPNKSNLSLEDTIRVNVQIIMKNSLANHFKAVEILDSSITSVGCLLQLVAKELEVTPVVTADLIISSKIPVKEISGVKVKDVILTEGSNLLLLIGTKILQHQADLKQILTYISRDGFVLSREDIPFIPQSNTYVDVVTVFTTPNEKIVLLRKHEEVSSRKFVEVSCKHFDWLTQLKSYLMTDECDVVVFGKNEDLGGTLGFANCLRREPYGKRVKCFLTMDVLPESENNKQLKKNLAVNVYKDKSWGTYRHLPLEMAEVECDRYGLDVSKVKWVQRGLVGSPEESTIVSTYYSSVSPENTIFDFAGRDLRGIRVFGITHGTITSHIVDPDLSWDVPSSWCLREAVTAPVAYATILYTLLMVGKLKPGSSILIHSVTNGLLVAALNICSYYNCNIYVTVDSPEEGVYLEEHHPQILVTNCGDPSLKDIITKRTRGEKVNVVLNLSSDDKLDVSLPFLVHGGCYLNVDKFELVNKPSFSHLLVEKEVSCHSVLFDQRTLSSREIKSKLRGLLCEGLRLGFVKPIPAVVFKKGDVEASFNYLTTKGRLGKVLLELRKEEETRVVVPKTIKFSATSRFNCNSHCSYIIIGGLGGFGLELAHWLVLRGAKKLVLVSRNGVQTGYQKQRIRLWRSHDVDVEVSTLNVTIQRGCLQLLTVTSKLGPVDGIFNLALVLKDALFLDQTKDSFLESLLPKARTTMCLDVASRQLCPQLRYFVCFSSISCSRGNIGQTNYGMANSVMERICEKRQDDGLPAVTIQWGAIGDVGILARMHKGKSDVVIAGTTQQRMSSCIDVLDKLLTQGCPVVSSMVIAEKLKVGSSVTGAIACVLGIKDMKTVSQQSNLAELGMDSILGTEAVQVLARQFQIYLTAEELRCLTLRE